MRRIEPGCRGDGLSPIVRFLSFPHCIYNTFMIEILLKALALCVSNLNSFKSKQQHVQGNTDLRVYAEPPPLKYRFPV